MPKFPYVFIFFIILSALCVEKKDRLLFFSTNVHTFKQHLKVAAGQGVVNVIHFQFAIV